MRAYHLCLIAVAVFVLLSLPDGVSNGAVEIVPNRPEWRKIKRSNGIFRKKKKNRKKWAKRFASTIANINTNSSPDLGLKPSIVSVIESMYSLTPPTMIIPTPGPEISENTTTIIPTATMMFNTNAANLQMVYKSVLPPGLNRPKNNVVFEYNDEEEGKTCRCVCRIKEI